MRYLSLCSGIEAASVAWRPLGWVPVAFSEIEPFPCALLACHYPDVPNLGDMTQVQDWRKYRGAVDLVVGGTPCQGFSVAGKRGGMADPRSGLARCYANLVGDVQPRWIVWENVPGVLSSGKGRDFGGFIRQLAEFGYGVSWRVLDAQYFGVPQRRRRVFVVGHFGDWRPAAAVLFEPGCLRRDSAPSRKAGADIAGTLDASLGSSRGAGTPPGAITQTLTGRMGEGGPDDNKAQGGFYVPEIVAQALSCKWSKGTSGPAGDEHHNLVATALRAEGFDASEDGTGRQNLVVAPPLTGNQYGDHESREGLLVPAQSPGAAPVFPKNVDMVASVAIRGREGGSNVEMRADGTANALRASEGGRRGEGCGAVLHRSAVRRLTPRECERLQGFPDDYTNIEYRGKPAADGPRYKALGNSMAVPVMRWIGERIQLYGE